MELLKGPFMAQSVKTRTLGFRSGRNLRVARLGPASGSTQSLLKFPSSSAPPLSAFSFLSKINK